MGEVQAETSIIEPFRIAGEHFSCAIVSEGGVVTAPDIILFALLAYLALFIFGLGWFGMVTRTPLLHRCPFTFHRPTLYLLLLGLMFLDEVVDFIGPFWSLLLFGALALEILYETARPFFSHSVEVESATQASIRTDLLSAFQDLRLHYQEKDDGSFVLPEQQAELKVRYWPKLQRGTLTIFPRSKMPLLLKIADIVEKHFEEEEGEADLRGYLGNILVAFVLFAFAASLLLRRGCDF